MGDFEIEREEENKNLSIGNLPDYPSGSIKIEQRDNYFNTDPSFNNSDDLGLDFIKNTQNTFEPESFTKPPSEKETDFYREHVEQTHNQNPIFTKPEESTKSYDDIQQEKAYFLSQLKRMEKRGMYTYRKLSMESSLEDVKSEFVRIKKEVDMQGNVQFAQQGLLFCVSAIERLSNNVPATKGKLEGWSQSMLTSSEDYDSVLAELCEKYSSGTMPPELKLLFMVGGSGFAFYQQKALVDRNMNRQRAEESNEWNYNSDKKYPVPNQKEMQGPSKSSEELLKRFRDLEDEDARSIASSDNEGKKDTLSIPINYTNPKKAGRPKKNKK